MVTLYVLHLSALPDEGQEGYRELFEMLSEERQKRIEKNQNQESRKQLLGAGILLRKVFGIYGFDENAIYKDRYGKPIVEGFHFNLSHTTDLVVCAVGERPVGCDVESIKIAPRGIAERFFSENEKVYLSSEEENYDEVFFRLWTMKESYIKMTGEGMHLPMDAFEIHLGDCVKVFREGGEQSCHIKEYGIPGYKVVVCAEENEFSEQWENIVK